LEHLPRPRRQSSGTPPSCVRWLQCYSSYMS